MRAAAAVPAVGLIVGSALGLLVPELPIRPGIALLLADAAVAVWAWRRARPRSLVVAAGAAFVVGGALLSAARWREAERPTLRIAFEALASQERQQAAREGRRLPEDDEAWAVVHGTLKADAATTPSGVSMLIDADSIDVARPFDGSTRAGATQAAGGGVQATVVGSMAVERLGEWRAGRRVRVPIQLHRPARYLDPDVPDYERALARRGTTLVGTVKSGALVEVIGRGTRLDEVMSATRAFARRATAASVGRWSPRSMAIVLAIVIGDRTGVGSDVERRLQEAGTYHVIAISGGNIAILAGLLLATFRLAGTLGPAAMLSSIAVLLAYARLVGGGASVDRATLMAIVYFGARTIDQRGAPINTLAVVVACLVVSEPLSAADAAFVLTCGATLAILWMAPIVGSWRLPRPLGAPATLLAASLATEVMLMPVGALVFARVTFAGLVLNFAAIPLMAIVQIAGMSLVPVALVSIRAAIVPGFVAHVAAEGLIRSSELVRFMPALSFRVAPPGWWAVAGYYAALLVLGGWGRYPRVRGMAIVCAAGAAIWIVAQPWRLLANRGDGRLHATFVDVAQGDAALIRFPRGRSLLVDAGGLGASSSFDVGDRVVAPVLRAAGVARLDYLVLTHGDPDHIGGASSVIREFRPREIWEGIPVPPFEPLRLLQGDAQTVRARWTNVTMGDRVSIDDVEVTVRSPAVPDWERRRVRNDDSIVLELRWRDVSVLLTGDIGKAVEHAIASSIPPAPLRIVKVPHHGSLTSSSAEIVRAFAPTVAVVSAGRANHFGHPVPEVIDRYRQSGAEVFRTDQDGAVTVETDGQTVSVHTFTGRRWTSSGTTASHHEGTKDTKP